MSKIDSAEFNEIIQTELPWAAESGMFLRDIQQGRAEIILPYQENSLRPGGTITGPHMMMLADICMYAVVLSLVGEVKLAVTTNFNINFLRRPRACDLVASGSIIKLGKRLAIIEVSIYNDEEIVAHATGTYSIPPIENS